MLKSFLSLFSDPAAPALTSGDAEFAIAVLLVRLARADGDYEEAERTRIDRVLAARDGLSPWEAAVLRGRAEEAESLAPDTVRFTRVIKDRIAYEDRIAVIEALWDVAFADHVRDAEEDALIRLTANLLGINDRDSALARQRVEARRA